MALQISVARERFLLTDFRNRPKITPMKQKKRAWPKEDPASVRELENIYRHDGECDEIACMSRQIVWDSGPMLLKRIRALEKMNKSQRQLLRNSGDKNRTFKAPKITL